jgi:hypothetical protein
VDLLMLTDHQIGMIIKDLMAEIYLKRNNYEECIF